MTGEARRKAATTRVVHAEAARSVSAHVRRP